MLDSNQSDGYSAGVMLTLRDYSLYPYLEYRALTQSPWQVSSSDVSALSARFQHYRLRVDLKSLFINELVRRDDLGGTLLAFAPTSPKLIEVHCNHLYSRFVMR
ncbi:MAG: hypothetical protein ACR5K7_04910 [Symbiopectobacterium sp.]